jgi:hypothetical protein
MFIDSLHLEVLIVGPVPREGTTRHRCWFSDDQYLELRDKLNSLKVSSSVLSLPSCTMRLYAWQESELCSTTVQVEQCLAENRVRGKIAGTERVLELPCRSLCLTPVIHYDNTIMTDDGRALFQIPEIYRKPLVYMNRWRYDSRRLLKHFTMTEW